MGTLLGGVLKVTRTLLDGRELIVALLYPGDFFGQIYSPTMDFSVEAATDVVVCVADRLSYEGVLMRHPGLEHAMLISTANALALARERSLLISCQSTLERVATYLLVVAERRNQVLRNMKLESQKIIADFAISRADLAKYLGTTHESISRNIHSLEDKGAIVILGPCRVEVIDSDRLKSIAGVGDDDLRLFSPEVAGEATRRHPAIPPLCVLDMPNR